MVSVRARATPAQACERKLKTFRSPECQCRSMERAILRKPCNPCPKFQRNTRVVLGGIPRRSIVAPSNSSINLTFKPPIDDYKKEGAIWHVVSMCNLFSMTTNQAV